MYRLSKTQLNKLEVSRVPNGRNSHWGSAGYLFYTNKDIVSLYRNIKRKREFPLVT